MRKYQKYFLLLSVLLIAALNSCSDEIVAPSPGYDDLVGHAESAIWSPDGSKLFYYGWNNETNEHGTYVMDMNNLVPSNRRKVSTDDLIDFTYDGSNELIYFNYFKGLLRRKVEGDTNSIILNDSTEYYFRSVSKDLQWIIYESDEGDPFKRYNLWKMRIDGSNKRQMIFDSTGRSYGNPKWFTDGVRMADYRWGAGEPQIAVLDTAGRTISILTNSPGYKRDISISPDGNYIAYGMDQNYGIIHIVKTDGTLHRQLTSGYSRTPTWSADSKYIAYTNMYPDGQIWITSIDGTYRKQLTNHF